MRQLKRPGIVQQCAVANILLGFAFVRSCVVYDLGTSSLPSAAATLFIAAPLFSSWNQTLYIDNHRNPFSCSETDGWENGWHDFFEAGDNVKWTPELEKEIGPKCRYINETDVLPLVPEIHVSYLELQTAAALQVSPRSCIVSPDHTIPVSHQKSGLDVHVVSRCSLDGRFPRENVIGVMQIEIRLHNTKSKYKNKMQQCGNNLSWLMQCLVVC